MSGPLDEVFRAWATALALVWLQQNAATVEGEWHLLAAKAQKWLDRAATVDLKTGVVRKLVDQNPSDFHFLTWSADGDAIGYGSGLHTSLWRFTPRK